MDEKPQPRNPNDLLIFQNIDTEDFEWQYDAIRTPLPYFIRAGETRELPYYIAKHGIDKLIDKMLQREGKIHTSPLFRSELYDKMVLGIKHINYIREKTANELELERMQRKKETDPIEEVLKKREIDEEQRRVKELNSAPTPLVEIKGQPTQPVVAQVSNPENPVVPTDTALNNIEAPEITPDADRQNVYNLLTNKLHMDLTHQPTKEKLDATPVEDIKKEFAPELPELLDPSKAVVPDTKESLSQPGMPVTPTQPAQVKQPVPAPILETPPAPQISMNPQASAAPLLDQQLAGN